MPGDVNAMQSHTGASNHAQVYFYANAISLASHSEFILQRALEDETGACNKFMNEKVFLIHSRRCNDFLRG